MRSTERALVFGHDLPDGEQCTAEITASVTYDSGGGDYAPGWDVEDTPESCPECGHEYTAREQRQITEAFTDEARDEARSARRGD